MNTETLSASNVMLPPVKVAVFAEVGFHGVHTYSYVPQEGHYLQLPGQKLLAYRVEKVIHLVTNDEGWEVAVFLGNGTSSPPKQQYLDAYYDVRDTRWRKEGAKYRDRKMFNSPNEAWQRRKNIYERLEAGEEAETIALELSIKPARVRQLATDWKHLKTRIYLYDQEEKDGKS